MKQSRPQQSNLNRREFLKTTGTSLVAGSAMARDAFAQNSTIDSTETIKVGLIGCGGRGTGAAAQALAADKNVKLVSMGDAFTDRLEKSLESLNAQDAIRAKIDVREDRRHVGFDAYKSVIADGVDVVLLTTPPHFRPIHLRAAVDAGKHVFAEKPVAVDAPGVRSVLDTCAQAKNKNLSIVSGLCLRYSYGFQEMIKRIHGGALGEIRTLQANDYRGPIWMKPRRPDWTDMHWQMRNWYYFTWLSGDFNVEQHVHYLDVCTWIMRNEYPVHAMGMGGRQVRIGKEYGNIYDHHSVVYEYANGVKLFSNCRQQPGCYNEMSSFVMGEKGTAEVSERRHVMSTGHSWKYDGPKNNFYQTEHDELFAGIRSGKPINNGEYMAKSTLLAIMGRMATYTGKQITWEQAMNSQENLTPERYEWGSIASPTVAMPGVTQFL